MAEKPTDTPSPLAAAVEALLKDVRHTGKLYPDGWTQWREVPADRVDALRAAVAADAAWRARAEAAVAFGDAVVAARKVLDARLEGGASDAEMYAADMLVGDTRRRYEDAACG